MLVGISYPCLDNSAAQVCIMQKARVKVALRKIDGCKKRRKEIKRKKTLNLNTMIIIRMLHYYVLIC